MLSIEKLTIAIAEHDFAMRAASHGARGSRAVLLDAIRNMPERCLASVRVAVEEAISTEVARTEAALAALGVQIDMRFPFHARASDACVDGVCLARSNIK